MKFRCGVFLTLISLTCLSEAKTVNRIVAWINDEIITQAEIDKAMNMLGSGIKPEQMDKLRRQVLDKLIEEKLILQEAKRQKIKVSVQEVEEELARIKSQFKSIDDFKKAIKEEGFTEDDLRKEYEENLIKGELVNSEVRANIQVSQEELSQIRNEYSYQIKVRHILVRTKPEAILILARLDRNESFEDLAKRYSIDKGNKDKGGLLDFFTKGKMVREFSEAAFALKRPGEISGIVETKFGFHIIQFVEKKELTQEELNELIKTQESKLRQAKFNEEFSGWINKLKEKSYIKIER
ncbi:MAG: peptidylprolyl isomerase [bacterium]|nr:peptidylprolyl isomerase [bacterium]